MIDSEIISSREMVQQNLFEFLEREFRGYIVEKFTRQLGKGKIRGIRFVNPGHLRSEILIYKPNQISVNGAGVLISKFAGFYESKDKLIEVFSKISP